MLLAGRLELRVIARTAARILAAVLASQALTPSARAYCVGGISADGGYLVPPSCYPDAPKYVPPPSTPTPAVLPSSNYNTTLGGGDYSANNTPTTIGAGLQAAGALIGIIDSLSGGGSAPSTVDNYAPLRAERSRQSAALNRQGIEYANAGDLDKAIAAFWQAPELAALADERDNVNITQKNLAITQANREMRIAKLQIKLGNDEAAAEAFLRARSLALSVQAKELDQDIMNQFTRLVDASRSKATTRVLAGAQSRSPDWAYARQVNGQWLYR